MALTKPRAHQLFDIDYKQAVRVLTDTNVSLTGGAPSTVDGVTLASGNRVLVIGQNTASQNGLYQVVTVGTGSNGTWIRSQDAAATGELLAGTIVMVTEGTVYADTQWKLVTNNPIVIGTTPLTWEQNSAFAFGNIFANGTAVLANTVGDTVSFVAGNNISITGNAAAKSVTIGVTGISLNSINNGTSNVNIATADGNVTAAVNGNTVLTITDTGANVTGYTTITGNITGGNINTAGQVVATGNVTGGNINTAGQVVATGNITGGNLLINNNAVITGNLSVQGTETIFNIQTLTVNDKDIVVANNVTGGANVDGAGILAGNPTVASWVFNNATTSWQSNIGITPTTNGTLDIGASSNRWNKVWVTTLDATGNANVGNIGAAAGIFTGAVSSSSTITATGNVTGGNIGTTGTVTTSTLGVAGNANVGNLGTAGQIVAIGNVSGGNLVTAGQVSASGNVSGNIFLGNGSQLLGINAFGNIAVFGESTVSADSTSDTLTFVEGSGIAITTDAANNTITIGAVATDSIFATGGDMGTVDEAVTAEEDLGLVTAVATIEYDLGTIVTAGILYPEQLVLPSFTVAELGGISANPAGQMVFCSNDAGGSIPAFSDGTNWRRVTDRQIVS